MLAAGRNDIWVTGDIWRFPTGLLLQRKLLNWSGGKWHSYTAPAACGPPRSPECPRPAPLPTSPADLADNPRTAPSLT